MPYIKLLTVLAGLVLLTACGGGTAKTPDKAGGNATDCTTNAFHNDCNTDAEALILRESMCLADTTADPTCTGATGIITLFCEADPFNPATPCVADAYDDERTVIIDGCRTNNAGAGCADVAIPYACNADAFDTLCGRNYTVGYCFTGDNLLTDSRCEYNVGDFGSPEYRDTNTLFTTATQVSCLEVPFFSSCAEALGDDIEIARANRLVYCNDLSNLDEFGACFGARAIHICNNGYPFANICLTEGNRANFVRVQSLFCLDQANIGDTRCTTRFDEDSCVRNPFADKCLDNDTNELSVLSNNIRDGQTNRLAFCSISANAGMPACDAFVFCRDTNPVSPRCGDSFKAEKTARVRLCAGGLSTNPLCLGDNIAGVCALDPFNATCLTDEMLNPARVSTITDCAIFANRNRTNCIGAYASPNYAAWRQTFFVQNSHDSLVNVNLETNKFLIGTATGLTTTGITGAVIPLTLADNDLGGLNTDGVAFFRGSFSNNAIYSYAGILSGTNLGAPLTAQTAMGTWNGRFQTMGEHTIPSGFVGKPPISVSVSTAFQLEVGFAPNTITAFVRIGDVGTIHYLLNGTYTDNGLITGNVILARFNVGARTVATSGRINTTDGTLTGLIGSGGAVGAFISADDGTTKHYAGGFVARPPAN